MNTKLTTHYETTFYTNILSTTRNKWYHKILPHLLNKFKDVEITIEYDIETTHWIERHPYGMGYAAENMSESNIVEDSIEFYCNEYDLTPKEERLIRIEILNNIEQLYDNI